MAEVFISYAHENSVNDVVLEFSNRLRTAFCIDAEIDQYEEAPAEGWPKWMTKQVEEAKYVLVLATKLYYQRAQDYNNDEKGGAGVKWETTLILQNLYDNVGANTKYIPIMLHAEDAQYIPLPLKPYTYYNVSDESDLKRLVARIKGTSVSKRPPLGTAEGADNHEEPLDAKERKSLFFSTLIDVDLWNKAGWSGVVYQTDSSNRTLPKIGLWFNDYKAGMEIFRGWLNDLGKEDSLDEMRLTIVENIDAKEPHSYRIGISSSPVVISKKMEAAGLDPAKNYQMILSRWHTMRPNNNVNLNRFKEAFKAQRTYVLTLAIVDSKNFTARLDPRFEIQKKEIFFRTKAEIERDRNDIDIAAL